MEIIIPEMSWRQISGDVNPGSYGGIIASGDGHTLELIEIQPVVEYVGKGEAAEVGFPFWTRVACYDLADLDLDRGDVRSAIQCCGLDEDWLEHGASPTQRALAIAECLMQYGSGVDEGPAGWSGEIGIPDKVEWASGKIAGDEYLADEDEEFRRDVLGEDDEAEDAEVAP